MGNIPFDSVLKVNEGAALSATGVGGIIEITGLELASAFFS